MYVQLWLTLINKETLLILRVQGKTMLYEAPKENGPPDHSQGCLPNAL